MNRPLNFSVATTVHGRNYCSAGTGFKFMHEEIKCSTKFIHINSKETQKSCFEIYFCPKVQFPSPLTRSLVRPTPKKKDVRRGRGWRQMDEREKSPSLPSNTKGAENLFFAPPFLGGRPSSAGKKASLLRLASSPFEAGGDGSQHKGGGHT